MTTLPVVFPDTVALAIAYLGPALEAQGSAAVVVAQVPDPRPALFLRVIRTGGLPDTPVSEAAQLTCDAWAADPADAHDLAQLARALLWQLPRNPTVVTVDGQPVTVQRVVDVGGPVDLPDPDSKQARYTFTLALSVRGRPLVTS